MPAVWLTSTSHWVNGPNHVTYLWLDWGPVFCLTLLHFPCHKMFQFLSSHQMAKKVAWPEFFVAFSVGITFLLPPVSFIAVLKLSRPPIHSSGWLQYHTSGLFGRRCIYLFVPISCSGNSFLLVLF